jgi:hypothetical protein
MTNDEREWNAYKLRIAKACKDWFNRPSSMYRVFSVKRLSDKEAKAMQKKQATKVKKQPVTKEMLLGVVADMYKCIHAAVKLAETQHLNPLAKATQQSLAHVLSVILRNNKFPTPEEAKDIVSTYDLLFKSFSEDNVDIKVQLTKKPHKARSRK